MITQHWISVDKCFLLNLRFRITSEIRETIHHIFVITNCIVKDLLFLVMVLPESASNPKSLISLYNSEISNSPC